MRRAAELRASAQWLAPNQPPVTMATPAADGALRLVPRGCLAPVTEIVFVHEATALLAASGSSLTLYQLATGRVLDQCHVFDAQRIHGIKSAYFDGRHLLIIFGGKAIAILELHAAAASSSHSASASFFSRIWSSPKRSDLIWDAKLLRCSETCAAFAAAGCFDVAIGYAHDRVELLSFAVQSGSAANAPLTLSCTSDQRQVQCEDRSLTYSMCLHGTCRHGLLVIGGTVFSQLLVWDASVCVPSVGTSSSSAGVETRAVIHRIAGHDGVIFRVEANSDASKLCSVSDDRTLRVWQWQSSGDASSSPVPLASLLTSSLGSYAPASVAYGHSARVWRCAMVEEWPIALSSSEDNTCIVWNAATGELLSKFSGQKGGLWSLCVDSTKRLAATGAGDGSIRLWSLDSVLKREGMIAASSTDADHDVSGAQSTTLHLQELLPLMPTVIESAASPEAVPPPAKKAKLSADNLSAVSSSSASAAIVAPLPKAKKPTSEYCRELILDVLDSTRTRCFFATNLGRVMRMDITNESGQQLRTQPTLLHHHTASPSAIVALALSPCKAFLAVGDQRGNLLLLSTEPTSGVTPLWLPNAHLSALNFIHFLPTASSTSHELITADAINEIRVFQLDHSSSTLQLGPRLTFRLPVSKARVTCAASITTEQLRSNAASVNQVDEDEEMPSPSLDDMVDVSAADNANPAGVFFVCGDNRGSAYVYFLPTTGVATSDASSPVALAIDRQLNVHEKAALTSISFGPTTAAGIKVCSTGTDGRVIEFALARSQAARIPLTAAWIDKHNQGQASSGGVLPDAATLAALAEWQFTRQRVHKLAQISSAKQVFFASSSASSPQRDLLVCGFHNTDLILWNLTQNTQVRRWTVGGDKRAWAFQPLAVPAQSADEHATPEDGFILLFARHDETKDAAGQASAAGELVLHCQLPTLSASTSSSSVPALGCATHGRLTTSLVAVPLQPRACLVITSSEDNTLKCFSVVTPDSSIGTDSVHTLPSTLPLRSSISCVATLVDHPDVVRAVTVSHERVIDTTVSCLLFSAGGRDFLHCSRVHATPPPAATSAAISVIIESLASVGGEVFHVTGKSHLAVRLEAEQQRMVKQDLRIMCLTAVPVPAHWIADPASATSSSSSSTHLDFVVSGNSAGVLKFYLFDSMRAEFRLLAECAHHAYTVLSVAHLLLADELMVFSGATDGRIMAWSAKQLVLQSIRGPSDTPLPSLEPVLRHQAHQSGVDCLSVSPASSAPGERSFRLFSGGDDEAISALTASLATGDTSADSPLTSVWSHTWANSHCSAVKSITLEGERLYTTSYDQRLREWTTTQQRQADGSLVLELHAAGACVMDVWDLSTVLAIPVAQSPRLLVDGAPVASPLLIVGGQGLQVLQLAR